MNIKRPGRPCGKVKTAKIEITIEPDIKNAFMELLHRQNMQASVVLREWVIAFLETQKKDNVR